MGHIDFFEKASTLGRVLTFIDSKERVSQIKPGAFCLDDKTRLKIIERFSSHNEYLSGVLDNWIFNSEEELKATIKIIWNMFKCNYGKDSNLIYAKGGDYKEEDLTLKPFIESLGGKIVIIPFLEGHSTSAIIKEIKEKNLT